MNINKFYEKEWISRKSQKFGEYSRNLALYEFFPPVNKQIKILDLACGNGTVSQFLLKRGYQVTAVDISKEAIRQTKKKGIKNTVILNIETKLPFKSRYFDIVFWGDNIEHIIYPEKVLKEISRVLKKTGRIIISTPNLGFIFYRWSFLKKGSMPCTEEIISDPWEWKHIRFFNFETLKNLLNKNSFKIIKIRGTIEPGIYGIFSKIYPKLFSSIIILEAININ